MVNIWAIVPAKPWNLAKSRLEPVLNRSQRAALAMAMLRHVLDVLTASAALRGVLVVSRDPRALAEAREYGVQTVLESGAPELNAALERAAHVTRSLGATSTLVLPADLPLLTTEDLDTLVSLGCSGERCVVLSPDRHEDGTNALMMCPPGLIRFAYGPGSFQAHLALAREAGADVHVWRSPRLAQDIDTPEDLALYRALAEAMGLPVIAPELLALVPNC